MQEIGRALIAIGVLAILVGGALVLGGRLPWFGRLPGDLVVHRGPVTFYFPIVTSLLVSVVLTVLFHLFSRK